MGSVKKKTQDYFRGEIMQYGQKIVDIYGCYMGYMDFNGVRYFDTRKVDQIYFPIIAVKDKALPSDSTKRIDSTTLAAKDMPEAQKMKELLEELQRKDRKLRETVELRREKGGPKFAKIF